MRVLKSIKSELICAIDVETVRIEDKFENLSEDYQSAWEYKNKHNGEVPNWDELPTLWENTASLYAEFSKICAVSLAYLDSKGGLVCKEFYGESEKELLSSVGIVLDNMFKRDSSYRLVGHAAKFFDYSFLCKRYIINRLPIPQVLDSSGLKPWEVSNLCTNELWKLGGTGSGSSLQALCTCLGIPTSKSDLVGDEVGKAYFNGELKRISRYCSQDTIADFNILRTFKGESIFQFDEVNYIVGYSEDGEQSETELPKDERTLLQRIYEDREISGETKEEIKKLTSKAKITKKDKENLFVILRGVLIREAFEFNDQDNKATIQQKEEQITNLINEL